MYINVVATCSDVVEYSWQNLTRFYSLTSARKYCRSYCNLKPYRVYLSGSGDMISFKEFSF